MSNGDRVTNQTDSGNCVSFRCDLFTQSRKTESLSFLTVSLPLIYVAVKLGGEWGGVGGRTGFEVKKKNQVEVSALARSRKVTSHLT